MRIVKTVIRVMIEKVKKSDYNCSPLDFYKPKKNI